MPYELSWGQASSSLSPGPQGSSQCLLHTCEMLSRYGDVFFYSVPARDPFCSPVISCLTVLPQLQLLCFLFLSSLTHCLISSSSHSSACPHLACEVRLAGVHTLECCFALTKLVHSLVLGADAWPLLTGAPSWRLEMHNGRGPSAAF